MSKLEIDSPSNHFNPQSSDSSVTDTIRRNLDKILANSDKALVIENIKKTVILLQEILQSSITYKRKSDIFEEISCLWSEVPERYLTDPKVIEVVRATVQIKEQAAIHRLIFMAFFLINENKTGDKTKDLKSIVEGLYWLSQTIDIFAGLIPESELRSIYEQVKKAFPKYEMTTEQYYKNFIGDPDGLKLLTQLRAYCSLIIIRAEEYFAEMKTETEDSDLASSEPWRKKIERTVSDNSTYDEAMKLGREYRESFRSNAE